MEQITVGLTITLEEAVYLMQRLSKMPYDEVANLLPKLKEQADRAVAAHQAKK